MPVSVEITYGLERILMAIQAVDHFRKILYAPGITYGELFMENEYDHVLKASHAFNILDARGALGVTERARFFSRMRRLARDCAQLWVKTRARLEHPLGLCQKPLAVPCISESVDEAASKLRSPRDFVLEIGSEELPPNDVINAFDQLQGEIKRLLERRRLDHGSVSIFGTPRRTVVYIKNLAPIQAAIIKNVRGPPCEKAFNEDGQPTKALEGFCKKNGISKDGIFIRTEGKSSYVFATLKDDGMHTIQVLSKELPEIIGRISFSKTMCWNSEVSYSRPIRWLLSMHGDVVVPFCLANVLSGNLTRGLRNSATPIIQITQAEEYIEGMQSAGILLGMQEREQSIWQRCSDLAKSIGGRILAEAHENLLQEVANLVECPFPLLGSFDERFLELPADVLTMVMCKHQRYFPVEETVTGQLLPAFVVVANGKVDETTVRKGNEAVLRARFEDAKFFYESDVSKPLADFRDRLKGILFQKKLGTMLDKNMRIGKIIKDLGMLMDLDEGSISTAQVAAPLVNADLGTYVVTEFTNLAGVMGRHYALREGQPLSVANAIFDSVLPRYAGDDLPRSHAGILLAVGDRLDSLVGLFSVGCEPSASADPFGLRRTAYGLVQALVENAMTMDLGKALSTIASIQPVKVSESTVSEVLTFIIRRLEQLLIDRGANVEIVRAVLSECGSNPMVAVESVKQLETLSKDNDFKKIIAACSRSAKLARPELVDISWMVNSYFFQEPEEEALWATYKQIVSELEPGVGVGDFVQASLKLVEPLNLFFDNVFVLVEDKTVQKNRLALLRKIVELPRGIVDLSVLPGFESAHI